MKNSCNPSAVERKKVISVMLLFATSILIIITGVTFGVISVVNDIYFTVFSSQIHGMIFGVVIAFLGVRYFISVVKLKTEVYKTTSKFSWSNFKKVKGNSAFSRSR